LKRHRYPLVEVIVSSRLRFEEALVAVIDVHIRKAGSLDIEVLEFIEIAPGEAGRD
jgi:hypothetical protein